MEGGLVGSAWYTCTRRLQGEMRFWVGDRPLRHMFYRTMQLNPLDRLMLDFDDSKIKGKV